MKLGSLLVLAYSCAEFKIPLTLVAHVKFNKKTQFLIHLSTLCRSHLQMKALVENPCGKFIHHL